MADNKIIYADELQKSIVDDVTIKGRAFAAVMRHIQETPAVDAVEVVHGRWITTYTLDTWMGTSKIDGYVCGVCGKHSKVKGNYCPNCGAKMDGGNEDE